MISRRNFLAVSAMTAAYFILDWKKVEAYAAKMGPKSEYPVVVIGAGLGGLCCAAHLSKFGVPVTVVEQHYIPGGYATSFERGDFTFEVSLHGTSVNNNPVERILKNLGVFEKLQFMEVPEFVHIKTENLDFSVPQRDPEALIQTLSGYFPEEKNGIRDFINEMIGIYEESDKLHRNNGKFFKLFFPIKYPKMWGVRNQTLNDLLNDYIKNPSLKNILSFNWGYYGLPPSKLSGFYYSVAVGEYIKNGSYYIKPRSQELSNVLSKTIESFGGKIICGTAAEKILFKDGAVNGVLLSDKKVLPARSVVSNASAITTLREMVPQVLLPAAYLKKLNEYKPSISTFMVWLGLNKPLRGKIKGYTITVPSNQGPEADYNSYMKGEIEKGTFYITLYDNVFEGYSKPGTSIISLLFLSGYEPWRKFETGYKAGHKKDYNEEKKRWTDILISRAEKEAIPGLSSMIEEQESATPLTNWYFTRNTEGAIYGFDQEMNNAFMDRIDNRTPINGLYLSGAWGNPGGGYGGVLRSGEITFNSMLEDWDN